MESGTGHWEEKFAVICINALEQGAEAYSKKTGSGEGLLNGSKA